MKEEGGGRVSGTSQTTQQSTAQDAATLDNDPDRMDPAPLFFLFFHLFTDSISFLLFFSCVDS